MSEQQLHHILEALLYASGQWLTQEELQKLSRTRDSQAVIASLVELQQKYKERAGPVQLENDGDRWKLNVIPQFIPYIKKVVTQTELTKSVLETLAIIAVRAPVLQSTIVKIRTNKAYDHLSLLENQGYVARKKEGRTKRIVLADKFYDYFDIPRDQLGEKFSRAREIESSVKATEQRVGDKLETYERTQEELKQSEEQRKQLSVTTTQELKNDVEQLKKRINETPEILNTLQTLPEEPEPVAEEPKKKRGRQPTKKEEQSTASQQESTPINEESAPEQLQQEVPEEKKTLEEPASEESSTPQELTENTTEEQSTSVEEETEDSSEEEDAASPPSTPQEQSATAPSLEQRTGLYAQGMTPAVKKIVDKKANELVGREEEDAGDEQRRETKDEEGKKEE